MKQPEGPHPPPACSPALSAFSATGTPFSVAAGRLSFTYGFSGKACIFLQCPKNNVPIPHMSFCVLPTGPAVSVDTACSSAMVGSHMALQHLQVWCEEAHT